MIPDLQFLQVFCWVLIGTTLCILAVTMGFDLGVGMLLPFVGRTDDERRVAINVIGPTWDGNQVWLIFGGGAFFACWPLVYATAFSGLYVALLLALWGLFLRPVGFEYRNKIEHSCWRGFWDWGLFVGSMTPALIFGVAFGNLLQGLPFHFDASLRSYYTGNFWGLLNPFGLLAGIISITMFVVHGSAFLQLRSQGYVQQRARFITKIGGILFIILFAVAGLWIARSIEGYRLVSVVDQPLIHPFASLVERASGGWLDNYVQHPWMILAPSMAFLGAVIAIVASAFYRSVWAFIGSALTVIGTVSTAGLSLFPFIIPSSIQLNESLTLWNATSSYYSLATFAIAVCVFLPFVAFYTLWVYRKLWRKMDETVIQKNRHALY